MRSGWTGGLLFSVLGLAIVFGVLQWRNRTPAIPRVYAFDANTGQLFEVPGDTDFPCRAPSGDLNGAKPGTKAGFYVVVARDKSGHNVVAYLETTDPVKGRLVRTAKDPSWYSIDSPAGFRVVSAAQELVKKGYTIGVAP